MPYPQIEDAIRNRIIQHFTLDDTVVVKGDLDKLFDEMQKSGSSQGVLLEYGGGKKLRDAPFNGKMWRWFIEGYYLVRYEGDSEAVETAARNAIERLFSLFDGRPTLGGVAAMVALAEVVRPDPVRINDIPFYWIPFGIEALEKI